MSSARGTSSLLDVRHPAAHHNRTRPYTASSAGRQGGGGSVIAHPDQLRANSRPPRQKLLDSGDRLLVLAPHPDDEALGTGGLLQAASALDVPVRVVFATNGERNPWAQRAVERRLWLDRNAATRFGHLRRTEARAAACDLGVPLASLDFLGLPDQGLTTMLVTQPETVIAPLAQCMMDWRPSVVVGPSPWDLHPDHSALAVAMDCAELRLPDGTGPRSLWTYLIHQRALRASRPPGCNLVLPLTWQLSKRRAIARHRSQHAWRGPWLAAFATIEERFIPLRLSLPDAPVAVSTRRAPSFVDLRVSGRPRIRAWGRRTLHLVTVSSHNTVRSLVCPLPPWSGSARLLEHPGGRAIGSVRYRGTPFGGSLQLPSSCLAGSRCAFAKISRRIGFFDEAGWCRLELA